MFNQDPDVRIDTPDDLYENKFRKVVNTLVKQQIQENVQKELQQIDKEAQSEILASKLEKIGEAIEKRTIQLERIDEDEDLKNLTDKKKLKALAKDIKILKKAQAKIEKELAKKDKSSKPQPEIIDEDGIIDEFQKSQADIDKLNQSAETSIELTDKLKTNIDTLEEDEDVTDKDADEYLAQQEKYVEDGVDKGETSTNYSDKSSNEPSEEYLEAKEEAESRYEEDEDVGDEEEMVKIAKEAENMYDKFTERMDDMEALESVLIEFSENKDFVRNHLMSMHNLGPAGND
jgi:hypothetical protein